jgi:hypothetical protein
VIEKKNKVAIEFGGSGGNILKQFAKYNLIFSNKNIYAEFILEECLVNFSYHNPMICK